MKQIKNRMQNKIAALSASAFVLMLPVVTFAQSSGLDGLIYDIGRWVGNLVPIAMSIGVLGFFWGLAKFLFGGAEEKSKGINIMIMGVLAVFVMASLGGIVAFLQESTGTENTDSTILRAPCVGDCTRR